MPDFVGYPRSKRVADEELLRKARERLTAARKFRRKNREQIWKSNEQQYEGNHWGAAVRDPAASLITVNMSFSTVNTILPFITAEEPRFLVEPYSLDAKVSNARLQQAWINRYWRSAESGATPAMETAVADQLIYGDGYLKITYQFEDKQVGPDEFTDIVKIYVDKVSPWDVWVDPNATSLNDSRYVIHRFYLTREEMEADEERYDKVDIEALPWGNTHSFSDDSAYNHEEHVSGVSDWLEIFEYYDTVTKVALTFTEGVEDPLLRVVEGVEPPIVQIPNYYLPRSPYHISELEQIKSIQEELNLARSELATHRRRNIAKYFVREDVLTQEGIDALTSPIVGQAVPINTDMPLSDVVQPMQIATLPSEAYGSADQASRDIYEITGVSEYLRGASPNIRRTATEASIIEGASNVKVQAKLSRVENAARRAGTIVLAIAKAVFPETDTDEMGLFLTGDEAQRALRAVQGEELAGMVEGQAPPEEMLAAAGDLSLPQDAELRPTEEMFVGEYEVFVESASTELRNPIFKEQKFREMAQTLTGAAPALQQLGVSLNLRKVYEKWFEAAGISDIEGMFESGQLPQQIPAQQPPLGGLGQPGPAEGAGAGLPNIGAGQPPLDGITSDSSGALEPTA